MKKTAVLILILILFCSSFCFAFEDLKEVELLFMAKKAYEDGFYEVSLGMLERFQKDFRNSSKLAQARLLSGQCYFNQGRYLEALNIFETLLNNAQAKSLKDAVYFWMAEVHFKGGNFQRSAGLYQKLIDEFPQSSYCPAAYYSLGWSFSQSGQYKHALDAFKRLLEKFPQEPQSKDAAFKLIECLYNLKEYSELKNKVNPIFKLYANDTLRLPYLFFYLAESEYYLNNFNEAARNYLKSAQTFGDQKVQALARLGLGWSYLKLAKYKEAEDIFSDIKQNLLDKKSLDIFILGQATLNSATNRIYEAKKLYDQLIATSGDPLILIQAYLGRADAFYNLAEYAQASASYEEALEKINNSVKSGIPEELIDKLQYNLGLSYIKQGKVESGARILKGSVRKIHNKERGANLFLQIGDAYAAAGEYSKAEESYSEILKVYPGSPYADYAQYQIGLSQLKQGNYERAVFSFEVFFKQYPQSKILPDAVYSLGVTYFQKGDYAKCSEIFAKFKNEFRDSQLRPHAYYMLGEAYLGLAKVNEALGIFKDIPRLYPQDIELLQKAEYQIADCYYKLGQENEAASRFKILRTKYPDSKLTPDILWWLGQYHYRRNELDLARRYFAALARDYSNSNLAVDAFYVIGLSFSDEDKFEQAVDNFKKVINTGRSELKVRGKISLGDIYMRKGMADEALVLYQDTAKDNPDLAKLLFPRIAGAYYAAGDYANAKLFYSKSLDLVEDKEIANIRFSLGEVLEARGEFDPAIRQYLLAADLCTLSPELSSRSLIRAAKLYEDKEEFQEALKIYSRIAPQGAEERDFVKQRIEWIRVNAKK